MPKFAMRDPNTGAMVPILGGVDQAAADARFLPQANPVMAGIFTVLNPTQANNPATKQYVERLLPVGSLMGWCGAGGYVQQWNWVHAAGQELDRVAYKDLYGVIGNTYGSGNGSTTFNLPDLQNRIPTAIYSGHANYNALGKAGGATDVTISQGQMPSASGWFQFHGAGSRTSCYNVYGGTGAAWGTNVVSQYGVPQYNQTGASSVGNFSLDYQGGGGSHSNVQPSLALYIYIKA